MYTNPKIYNSPAQFWYHLLEQTVPGIWLNPGACGFVQTAAAACAEACIIEVTRGAIHGAIKAATDIQRARKPLNAGSSIVHGEGSPVSQVTSVKINPFGGGILLLPGLEVIGCTMKIFVEFIRILIRSCHICFSVAFEVEELYR